MINIKLVSKIIIGGILLCLFIGCKANKNSIEKPPFQMNNVSQNSKYDLITFKFKLPPDWIYGPEYEFSTIACPKVVETMEHMNELEILPFKLTIESYYINGLTKNKTVFEDLFNDKIDSYKAQINQSIYNSKNLNLDGGTNFLDYLNFISPKENDSGQSNNFEYISNFKCEHYNGTNGKITEVKYTYNDNNKEYRIIECYREDIPYVVTGAFSDDIEISSGDIAFFVADSLNIKEHFTIKDGQLIKEN